VLDVERRILDLGAGEADIALRPAQKHDDPTLTARKLLDDKWALYCAKDYATPPRSLVAAVSHPFATLTGKPQEMLMQAPVRIDIRYSMNTLVGPDADARLRKRIVRSLIQEVVVDVEDAAAEIVLLIHWKGGAHSELRFPRRRRGQKNAHSSPEIIGAVRALANICTDDLIASALNRSGLPTGRGNRWSRMHVTSLRTHHKIPCFDKQRCAEEGWINQTQAANFSDISAGALRLAVSRGQTEAQHPLPDGPCVFNRRSLQTSAATELVRRIKNGRLDPTACNTDQNMIDFSST
jgi:hypothetical protein